VTHVQSLPGTALLDPSQKSTFDGEFKNLCTYQEVQDADCCQSQTWTRFLIRLIFLLYQESIFRN